VVEVVVVVEGEVTRRAVEVEMEMEEATRLLTIIEVIVTRPIHHHNRATRVNKLQDYRTMLFNDICFFLKLCLLKFKDECIDIWVLSGCD